MRLIKRRLSVCPSLVTILLLCWIYVGALSASRLPHKRNLNPSNITNQPIPSLESIFLGNDTNQVISSFSIYSSLLPLQLGADGTSKTELDRALNGYDPSILQSISQVQNANNSNVVGTTVVFSSNNLALQPEYSERLIKHGITSIPNFDFKNYETINQAIENSTKGLIKNLVGPSSLSSETQLVIINGIYFAGKWKNPFQPGFHPVPFTLFNGSTIETPMMSQRSSNYIAKVPTLDASIIDLPYKLSNKFLRIYLPNTNDGLPDLMERLRNFSNTSIHFKFSEMEVTIPKFKIETEIRVTNGLERLGLQSLLSSTSNLSRIAQKSFRVDEIISKSIIDVSEQGTEAGSATAIYLIPLSGFQPDEFTANRPFYFEVRDLNTIYFSGTFTSPEGPAQVSQDFGTRSNPPRPLKLISPMPSRIPSPGEVKPEIEISSTQPETGNEVRWWHKPSLPVYLTVPPSTLLPVSNSTPRFQQPEPFYPSGIRFPYQPKNPNTKLVIETNGRNESVNTIAT